MSAGTSELVYEDGVMRIYWDADVGYVEMGYADAEMLPGQYGDEQFKLGMERILQTIKAAGCTMKIVVLR